MYQNKFRKSWRILKKEANRHTDYQELFCPDKQIPRKVFLEIQMVAIVFIDIVNSTKFSSPQTHSNMNLHRDSAELSLMQLSKKNDRNLDLWIY